MRFRELQENLSSSDLAAAEMFANRTLGRLGIDVEFTQHFRERINLPRNKPKIKLAELVRLFRQLARQQGKRLQEIEPYTKILVHDTKTKLNIIINIKEGSTEDRLLFSCGTIIRATNFGKDAKTTIFLEAVGRITKQNQTQDVGPQEIKRQAAKFGNTVDKDGRPPTLSKKTKGSKTNVLYNLGLAEKWSKKYKDSIDCSNPKGFSQKAHCAGKKKNEDREIGIHRSSEDFAVIDLSKSADGTFWLNGVDNTDWDSTVTTGKGVDIAFEISPRAKLASYDDIDKYSTGELENMGYDGVRMIDGDNVSYQIWNTDVLKRTQLGENFADGKKKGKSRPGRAKRAGVDCSKSVTALRKQAKNSSGEKQKMAHWCANMKSGRKKS